LKSLKNQ